MGAARLQHAVAARHLHGPAGVVQGEPALAARFEDTRRGVLSTQRDPAALAGEVTSMRERLREAHAAGDGEFDLKHSRGGMIDVEFAVQYLVLAHSCEHPCLLDNVGNIALLQRAEDVGLLPEGLGARAGKAYRELRRLQHRARLDEAPTKLTDEALAAADTHRQAVMALWGHVFPEA